MKLYHYSNEEFEIISPKYFKANSHTPGDSEVPRSYFYCNKHDREKFFLGSVNRYTISVDGNEIYDLLYDELGLLNRFGSIDDVLIELKKRKFIGFRFYNSETREVVALFYAQKIIEREKLC